MDRTALLDRLDGVSRCGSGWKARCPAHDDHRASLSVCERDWRILIHCFAGYPTSDILDALDLGWDSLFSGDDND